MICHLFLEIGAKVKNSKDQATFSHIPCIISPSPDFQCFLCLKVCWHILYQVEFFVKLKSVGQQPPCMLFYRNEMRKVHFGRSSHTKPASDACMHLSIHNNDVTLEMHNFCRTKCYLFIFQKIFKPYLDKNRKNWRNATLFIISNFPSILVRDHSNITYLNSLQKWTYFNSQVFEMKMLAIHFCTG